jgi:hypothetical protein
MRASYLHAIARYPVTAPVAADDTSRAYFASTPEL